MASPLQETLDLQFRRLVAKAGIEAELFARQMQQYFDAGVKVGDTEMATFEDIKRQASDLRDAAAKTREGG